MSAINIIEGDVLDRLRELPDETFQCVVTSPPYWGLRDYGIDGQLGLESTPEAYLARMVDVFSEVRRVLRKDGTLWLNMGDSYAANGISGLGTTEGHGKFRGGAKTDSRIRERTCPAGLKPKDLCGMPWRLALALQADGWWLRQDIIWAKPNPMPESCTDRCTKAHEYVFLLTKSARYFWDAEAVAEPVTPDMAWRAERGYTRGGNGKVDASRCDADTLRGEQSKEIKGGTRNRRDVWTIASEPYPEAHFATFPQELPKLCILAGTSARGACPKCGAPHERVVTEKPTVKPVDYAGKNSMLTDPQSAARRLHGNVKARREAGATHENAFPRVTTTGWRPTCECGEASTVPCRVLDPFGGSGTTGQVALELGRHATLIELNPDYVALACRRCDVTLGLALA